LHDPIFLVAEFGRTKPPRALFAEEMAAFLQLFDDPFDKPGIEQRSLREP